MDIPYNPYPQATPSRARPVLFAGLFSLLPLGFTRLIHAPAFSQIRVTEILLFAALSVLLATVTIALYQTSVRRWTTPHLHPQRRKLYYTFFGLALALSLTQSSITTVQACIAGVLLTYIIVFSLRSHLVTETIFSGLGLGSLFVVTAYVSKHVLPTGIDDVWLNLTDANLPLVDMPAQQVTIMFLLGMLAGPVYLACKDTPQRVPGPFSTVYLRPKKIIGGSALLLIGIPMSWFLFTFTLTPQSVEANQAETSLTLDSEIRITFSRPVNRTAIRLRIDPPTDGTWEFHNLSLQDRLFRTAVFKPETVLKPGQSYTVYLDDVRTLFREKQESYRLTFQTEGTPSVASSSITAKNGTVKACDPITVRFNQALSSYWVPEFALSPTADLTVTRDKAEYILTTKNCLEQGTDYTLSVLLSVVQSGEKTKTTIYSERFHTNPAPSLTKHNPAGDSVLTSTPSIELVFTNSMQAESSNDYLSVTPHVEGAWTWSEDNTKALYTFSQPLAFATRYTVTVRKGFPERNGGFLPQDNTVTFTTIGPVKVASVAPSTGSSTIAPTTAVTVTFNQEVDHASAEQRFSLVPTVEGSFNWKGTAMTFKPKAALAYSTTYKVNVAAGVESVHGQDLPTEFSSSFTVKAAPPPPPTLITLGSSEQGRAISGYVFGKGSNAILLFGAIHGGKEKSSGLLMEKLVQELSKDTSKVSKDKTIIVVPIANPDGYFTRTDKFNSREVNLNINFDTLGWKMYGGEHNDFAGNEPFSESETRALRDVVSKYKVTSMVAFHATGGIVNPESGHSPSQVLARRYASKSGYGYYEDPAWDWAGTATGWFKEKNGGAAVTVELRSYSVADWTAHKNALYDLIQ